MQGSYMPRPLSAKGIEEMTTVNRLNGRIIALQRERDSLKTALHAIYEVYAGSDGFIPQYASEAYLQRIIKEMADIAGKHK